MVEKKGVGKKSSKDVFKRMKFSQKKFDLAKKRLIFFGLGFIVSFVFYLISKNEMLEEIFGFLSIIFGFISASFLIIFLIFLFMRFIRK